VTGYEATFFFFFFFCGNGVLNKGLNLVRQVLYHLSHSTSIIKKKEKEKKRCRWLTPVILATQEAEIRKIRFKASLGK
jgi:hypothetical protein